ADGSDDPRRGGVVERLEGFRPRAGAGYSAGEDRRDGTKRLLDRDASLDPVREGQERRRDGASFARRERHGVAGLRGGLRRVVGGREADRERERGQRPGGAGPDLV